MDHLNRRRFLQTATAFGLSATGAATSSHAGTAEALKRKFTMCLSCGAIGVRADVREAIRLAHQYGFESLAPSTSFLAGLSEAELEELLAQLRAKNLVWGAAGLPVNFRGQQTQFVESCRKLPELAAALRRAGVTRVATWISPASKTLTYLANFRQHARRLREVAKILGDHGQRFGLEYVGPKTSWTASKYPFIHTMAEMKELIAEIGQPNVGFLLDSWHWYTAGESEADLLTLTNRDVVACHLNDAPAGIPLDQQRDGTRALPCATGVIDLKTFLGALLKIGYDGPILAEPFDKNLRAMKKEEAVAATAAAMHKAFALVE